jgi:hypothetical protein
MNKPKVETIPKIHLLEKDPEDGSVFTVSKYDLIDFDKCNKSHDMSGSLMNHPMVE